jgi:2-C-methyl-D-erythritol 4-phosphate cytidylyltransferase
MATTSLQIALFVICFCCIYHSANGFGLYGLSSWKSRITSSKLLIPNSQKPADSTNLIAAQPDLKNVAVILLAGGKGTRMKSVVPKQFLPLLGKPVFLRSLDIFRSMKGIVSNIIIVLDESFREEYNHILAEDNRICWADPGIERQGSVFNGLNAVPDGCSIVAVHDAARPLVTVEEVKNVLSDGMKYGAAVLGVPMKATVKESADGQFVLRTVERSRLWEIHTPQVASKSLFLEGFAKVNAEKLEVTDDVSVIEALGKPVKLTLGQYTNIKLTTPDDLQIAEQVLRERGVVDVGKDTLVELEDSESSNKRIYF